MVSVRDASGRVVWQPSVDGFNALQLSLAPDASAITDGRHVATRTHSFALPGGFQAQGWLDPHTLVGRQGTGDLEYLSIDSPTTPHGLGFKGDFVGSLTGR